MRFPKLANWAKDDIATIKETWLEFANRIDWVGLLLYVFAVSILALFWSVPFLVSE